MTRHASQELGSKGGVLLQESPVLISLHVLTFLSVLTVIPVTPTHVPRPPLFINYIDLTCSVSLSKCLCIKHV